MNILVPLNRVTYLEKYIEAGADEFYIGFYDCQWEKKFGEFADINRMSGFGRAANNYSFDEMLRICKTIKDKGKSVYITLNANTYSQEQIEYIKKHYLAPIKMSGIDGVIVSDFYLAEQLKEHQVNVVASTMCGIYNSDIASQYIERGVNRIILPRELSLVEIESIVNENPDAEYEIFFMRNGCVFSDSYCLGTHIVGCGSTCGFVKKSNKQIMTSHNNFDQRHQIELNSLIYDEFLYNAACGMCSLYRINQIGVKTLKIVGRADNCESICEDIALTKRNLKLLELCTSEEDYLRKMEFPSNSYYKCKLGLSCYYPETRFL